MRVAVIGATGRMGQTIIQSLLHISGCQLTVAIDAPNSPHLGKDAGFFINQETRVIIQSEISAIRNADVYIDFTRPEASIDLLEKACEYAIPAVIGTTGFSVEQLQKIDEYAKVIPIVQAYNMSIGVNVCLQLLEQASKLLGADYDVEVFELHHNKKVDAPSGTAIAMAEAVTKANDTNLQEVATWTRQGIVGPRTANTIGFSVARGGDVVGDHTVFFCGPGERVEITHRSSSRNTYAEGSIRAAQFLVQQKVAKRYSMRDVLLIAANHAI